jgi:hypothetical protein
LERRGGPRQIGLEQAGDPREHDLARLEGRERGGLRRVEHPPVQVTALQDQGGVSLAGIDDALGSGHDVAIDERHRRRPLEEGLERLDARLGRRALHQGVLDDRESRRVGQ